MHDNDFDDVAEAIRGSLVGVNTNQIVRRLSDEQCNAWDRRTVGLGKRAQRAG